MKAAVILSGCGYMDGAEIRESVLTLLYLDEHNVETTIYAPDVSQHHVVNHLTGEPDDTQTRQVLQEAARIARGDVLALEELDMEAYDALLIPGGFGVAKNLSNFAFKGNDATVYEEFGRVVQECHEAGKPIGAICIAPVLVANILKGANAKMTIGDDPACTEAICAFGNRHDNAATIDAVIDTEARIASCSAYMRDDARLSDVATGIRKVVEAVINMAQSQAEEAA